MVQDIGEIKTLVRVLDTELPRDGDDCLILVRRRGRADRDPGQNEAGGGTVADKPLSDFYTYIFTYKLYRGFA